MKVLDKTIQHRRELISIRRYYSTVSKIEPLYKVEHKTEVITNTHKKGVLEEEKKVKKLPAKKIKEKKETLKDVGLFSLIKQLLPKDEEGKKSIIDEQIVKIAPYLTAWRSFIITFKYDMVKEHVDGKDKIVLMHDFKMDIRGNGQATYCKECFKLAKFFKDNFKNTTINKGK